MIKTTIFGMIILFMIFSACSFRIPNSSEIIVLDLDTPWEMDFLPDGSIIFTQRDGTLNVFNGTFKEIARLEVEEVSEAGLLGMALEPSFADNNHVYLYYTYNSGSGPTNRVSRFTLEDQSLINEIVLLDGIPSARFHNGGRIAFGPDGKLYVTTGDATEPSQAQDINSLAGKILRMNSDGSIPNDNPFRNYIYSYGHRNPQGLAWHKGILFSSEHGPNMHDELNIIKKGGNYGWPDTCEEQANGTIKPIRCYVEFTLAPGDIAFLDGDLYVTGLRGTQLRKIVLDENQEVVLEEVLIDDVGRLRAIAVHEESLYISTSNKDGRGIPRSGDDKIIKYVPEKILQ